MCGVTTGLGKYWGSADFCHHRIITVKNRTASIAHKHAHTHTHTYLT